ncbi:MAG TPA: EAL domain-containing protein [Conexibacter sp.]|nr:EAL domain-containing protein [Conexibacter sp.]
MSERSNLWQGPQLSPASELGEILRRGMIRSVFQPVVDLDTGALFGFEALARGPEGSPLEQPAQLFAAARDEGRVGELDHACQRAAMNGVRRHRLQAPLAVFVNAELDSVGFGPLPPVDSGVRAVVELKERCLAGHLPELLPAVQRARSDGWGVALDDIGADLRRLALMPVVYPDVIKLDLRRLEQRSAWDAHAIAEAVCVQAEQTGATVLAEGIESAAQLQHARALGATLGQGHHLGRPVEQPRRAQVTGTPLALPAPAMPAAWRTPFDLASVHRPVRRGPERLLAAISSELERKAATTQSATLLIRSLPEPGGAIRSTFDHRELDQRLVTEHDPLHGTWNVLAISTGSASMLAARQHGRERSRRQQVFDFVVTHDRGIVVECAQALMLRPGVVDIFDPR